MTYENFMEWTRPDNMVKQKVKVGLPRFKMTQTYDNMKDLPFSTGLEDLFSCTVTCLVGTTQVDHKIQLGYPIKTLFGWATLFAIL